MAFVPTPNVVAVAILGIQDNQEVENTLWFSKSTGWDVVSATLLGEALIAWWAQYIGPVTCSTFRLRGVSLSDQSASDGFSIEVFPDEEITGQDPNGPVPSQVAFVVKFTTAARGRSGRGRNYCMAFPENRVAQSTIEGNLASAYVIAYNALKTVASANQCTWGIVSKQIDGVKRSQGLFRPILQALYTNLIVDTQRRRLPGHGS